MRAHNQYTAGNWNALQGEDGTGVKITNGTREFACFNLQMYIFAYGYKDSWNLG